MSYACPCYLQFYIYVLSFTKKVARVEVELFNQPSYIGYCTLEATSKNNLEVH